LAKAGQLSNELRARSVRHQPYEMLRHAGYGRSAGPIREAHWNPKDQPACGVREELI
jgi:hypothetical protein